MATMDVEYVAKLARLHLSAEEKKVLSSQMAGILDFMEKLSQLDTSSIAQTQHILSLQNVSRPDVVKPSIAIEKILKTAPSSRDDFFIVPQVIE